MVVFSHRLDSMTFKKGFSRLIDSVILRQLLLPAPSAARNPAHNPQQPSTKFWDPLPSKRASKAQTYYTEIIRMLLVMYPSGAARAAIRHLTHTKSFLTFIPLLSTSSPKTTQPKKPRGSR